MDNISSGYQPEDYTADNFAEGDYKVKIKSVETKVAQSSGNPMIVLTLTAQGCLFDFRYNIVKNEHFNANATRFFDCFKTPRGNFEYSRWVGRVGEAHIAKGKTKDNGKSYWEIQYLLVGSAPQPMKEGIDYPPPRAPAPPASAAPAFVANPPSVCDGFVDDIPF